MNTTRQKPDYIATLIREGCEVKKDKIPCPFHLEKTPSFVIYPETQKGHCFGCGWHGDIIAFIMQYRGLSFKETLAYLGISNTAQKFRPKTSNKKQRLLKSFRLWEKEKHDTLALLLRGIRKIVVDGYQDMEAVTADAALFHALPELEYKHEILCGRDDAQKCELFLKEGNNAIG